VKSKLSRRAIAALGALAVVVALSPIALAADVIVLKAGKLYTGDGDVVENGMVVIRNGRIAAVGAGLPVPDGARVFESPEGCLTAGLVDASSTVGIAESDSWAEHASEVIPQLRVLDAVDFDHPGFRRLARQGVTTVYIGADPASVIGARGAVVKTGEGPPSSRVLRDAAQVKLTVGAEPALRGIRNSEPRGGRSSYLTRRPITRMGTAWVFREAMYRATAYAEGKRDAADADPAMEELVRVLRGEATLRVQARSVHDIETAFRLTGEFGIRRFLLEEGIEAARCLDRIREAGIPVIYGPIQESPSGWRGGDIERPALSTPLLLHEAGVPLALSAVDLDGEEALPGQAMMAVRFGLPVDAALRAVTRTPAELLGVADRIGTLAAGRDADVVLWSGDLFEATTRADVVVINGTIVHDGTSE
jgi:imidazolonepropionase-like amidohydrolase